jgi:hypothetical protein
VAPGWPALSPLDVAFIALVLALVLASRRWVWMYALVTLPGTFLHELSHWGVALLSGGRPTAPSVLPVRSERGWRLGAVGVRQVRWFNALPIGFAPLLLAPLAWLALRHAAGIDAAHWTHWAGLYVAAVMAASCLPSRADARIVVSRPSGLLAYGALAALAAWAWWR